MNEPQWTSVPPTAWGVYDRRRDENAFSETVLVVFDGARLVCQTRGERILWPLPWYPDYQWRGPYDTGLIPRVSIVGAAKVLASYLKYRIA